MATVGFEVGVRVVGFKVEVGDCVGSVGEPVDLVGLAEGWNVKGDFVAPTPHPVPTGTTFRAVK